MYIACKGVSIATVAWHKRAVNRGTAKRCSQLCSFHYFSQNKIVSNCILRFCYHQFSGLRPTVEANLKTLSCQKYIFSRTLSFLNYLFFCLSMYRRKQYLIFVTFTSIARYLPFNLYVHAINPKNILLNLSHKGNSEIKLSYTRTRSKPSTS